MNPLLFYSKYHKHSRRTAHNIISRWEAIWEEECQRRDIELFVLPPHSPKLNGGIEQAHRTHTEEFYEATESSFELSELRDELLEWEGVYNPVRPHQALGYVTPFEFLEQRTAVTAGDKNVRKGECVTNHTDGYNYL